jgi:hypothetical protein
MDSFGVLRESAAPLSGPRSEGSAKLAPSAARVMDVADGFRVHPDSGGLEDRMQQ